MTGRFRCITDILFDTTVATPIAFGANDRWLGGKLALSLVRIPGRRTSTVTCVGYRISGNWR
ncbi:hypothetical protein ACFQAT_27915 [Undibacterium arcticum]|uniref:Uncharacterized protein n=1 Tax=Undibacterium arcticum TaxID=1762892 RepID=A0ABV7F6A4_9BURK